MLTLPPSSLLGLKIKLLGAVLYEFPQSTEPFQCFLDLYEGAMSRFDPSCKEPTADLREWFHHMMNVVRIHGRIRGPSDPEYNSCRVTHDTQGFLVIKVDGRVRGAFADSDMLATHFAMAIQEVDAIDDKIAELRRSVANAIRWHYYDRERGIHSADPSRNGMDPDRLRELIGCLNPTAQPHQIEALEEEGKAWAYEELNMPYESPSFGVLAWDEALARSQQRLVTK